MKRYAIMIFSAALALLAAGAGAAQAAEEILSRMDANASFRSIRYSARMEITIGGETRVKTMRAVAEGSAKAFIEFTNPEDRGVRYLKLDKSLWMFFPKERDTVKISGHLLKEGMMGSDLSYEDALESADYKARYTASLVGREELEGRPCFVVRLDAKPVAAGASAAGASAAPYERRVMWIDEERYVSLKEEMYARSGKLLKVSRSLEVGKVGKRWFATRVELESKLRRNTRTVFSLGELEMDAAVDPRQFTMGALTK
jgi:outer membrane lipoprotein-sorting protein